MKHHLDTPAGAKFSDCRTFRYVLWRIWNYEKPFVMFIGLNPSKADETKPDPTITRVAGFARQHGYGGLFMCNCFPFVTPYPELLKENENLATNDLMLKQVAAICQDVVFAWGNFKIVKDTARDIELCAMFPNAKTLVRNKDGSPRHPLYVPAKTDLIPFLNTPNDLPF